MLNDLKFRYSILGFSGGLSFITTNDEKWKEHWKNASTKKDEIWLV